MQFKRFGGGGYFFFCIPHVQTHAPRVNRERLRVPWMRMRACKVSVWITPRCTYQAENIQLWKMLFHSLFLYSLLCSEPIHLACTGDVCRPQHQNVQPKLRHRISNWLFPPVFLSCGRSISWICWCFYTLSSLTVWKVHCSFIERLMLKDYLIKCFIVRCHRKSYFWCYETSIIFFARISISPSSRETLRFKRILIFNFVLTKKKLKCQRMFFSEEEMICLFFKIEWAGKWGKTIVSNFFNVQMTIVRSR